MRAVAAAGLTLLTALAGLAWWATEFLTVSALPPRETRAFETKAIAGSTVEGTVSTKRRGRVRALKVVPGNRVAAGDPLIEFDDLGLFDSKGELRARIARLNEEASEAAQLDSERARQESLQLRLAALRHVEESHEIAREEFERWQDLHDQGLVARVDFQRKQAEFAAASERLEAARAAVTESEQRIQQAPRPSDSSPDLRRAERLLARLERLPETFVISSPWSGVVRAVHVAAGETPGQGAPLVALARDALLRLEARLGGERIVLAVQSACGVPGPFRFAVRDGSVFLAAPPVGLQAGGACTVTVVAAAARN